MGENMLMRGRMQPHGHWEDRDFLKLNEDILRAARGRWNVPPSRSAILKVRGQFNTRIRDLVRQKNRRQRWGWKDPRTSLTVELYHPHLVSPRYIRIVREKAKVIQSLQRRHKGGSGWGVLHDVYIQRTTDFLKNKPHLVVRYSALVDANTRRGEIERVNDWINGNGRIGIAMERVHDKS